MTDDYFALQRYRVFNGITKDNGVTCSDYISEMKIQRIITEIEQDKDMMKQLKGYGLKQHHIQVARRRIERLKGQPLSDLVDKFYDYPITTLIEVYKSVKNSKKINVPEGSEIKNKFDEKEDE
jgi:hypothetical protein